MLGFTIVACYALTICLAHAVHAAGRAHGKAPTTPTADEIDHNFDSMWESASR